MPKQRADLGASFARLTRAMIEAETPLLAEHGVTMWEYVVLAGLEHGPAQSQVELAAAVGRDKTRLIPILDRLAERGLVVRTPDPADRRNRVVELTTQGRDVLRSCRTAIRAMESRFLARLNTNARAAFLAALETLDSSIG